MKQTHELSVIPPSPGRRPTRADKALKRVKVTSHGIDRAATVNRRADGGRKGQVKGEVNM